MKPLKSRLPSAGFSILVMSYVGVAAFLFSGGAKPRLDEAFELLEQMQSSPLSSIEPKQIATLEGVLRDYPEFSRALMGRGQAKLLEQDSDGWLHGEKGHLAVRPDKKSPTRLLIETRASGASYPISIRAVGGQVDKTMTINSAVPVALELSQSELLQPSILRIEVARDKAVPVPPPPVSLRLVTEVHVANREPQ